MTLWRRAPREVYRVYGEEEYLAGGEANVRDERRLEMDAASDEETRRFSHGEKAPSLSPSRLIGLGLLVCVALVAFVLVLSNATHRQSAAQTGVTPGSKSRSADRQSVGVLADRKLAARASTVTVSSPPESVRPLIHSRLRQLPSRRSPPGNQSDPTQSAAAVETIELQPSTAGFSHTAASRAEDEFDFEH
jgi:hypothetical protein